MPQIAGFRGAVWDPSKVDLAKVVAGPAPGTKDRIAKGELVRDPTRTMYRYAQTFEYGGRRVSRLMLVCAVRLAPWSEGSIRPHEATDPRAKAAATKGISEAGAHTEPVYAGYRDAARELDRLLRGVEDGRPALDTTTADGVQHRLWRVSSAEALGKLRTLFAPKKLHVLDGHARYEGMLAYAESINADAQPQYSSAKFGLAALVNLEEVTLVVSARHRVIRGEDIARDKVLAAARTHFIVDKLTGGAKDGPRQAAALADTVAHLPAFILTFAGDPDAWKLTLKPDVAPANEGVSVHRALQKYDPVVLEQLFLARCVPGGTSTTEREIGAVLAAVGGGAALGIVMRPLTLEQIVHADEVGAVVPFGSTLFMPPVANMVAMLIDPDEDLA